jgi:DNA topoisomerase-2
MKYYDGSLLSNLVTTVEEVETFFADNFNFYYDFSEFGLYDVTIKVVVENMAKPYGNNINILTTEGDFGNRTSKGAAAPRYTSTRFSQAARLIFRKEDNPILEEQEFEGKLIEPKYLLPNLPVSLVNGYNAIAVGFASKFLPRNPIDVIEEMQKALKYKKRKNAKWEEYNVGNLAPAYPFYSGSIYYDGEHSDSSAWILTGAFRKTKKRNVIEITDLPPEASREGYIKKLKRLQDRGLVKDFTESCVKNNFKFSVKVAPDLWKKSDEQLMDILGLVDKVVENFTFF